MIEHTEDVIPEMEHHGGFGIEEIIEDLETRENSPKRADVRMKVNKALEDIDRQHFVEGGGE